ncbi:MAG: hypothetical protein P4L31_06900 [Candidatus Babeliales bacterium]|nr:hypothetical protein [Candidatus Babeliales bacterium]
MKRIIITVLFSSLCVGNLFSDDRDVQTVSKNQEQTQILAPNRFALEEIGRPLNGILGHPAFVTKNKAILYDIKFDKNNMFARKELVIVPANSTTTNGKQIYGIVLGRQGQSDLWYVQIAPDKNVSLVKMERPQLIHVADIGKIAVAPN